MYLETSKTAVYFASHYTDSLDPSWKGKTWNQIFYEGNVSRISDFTWAFFWSRNCSVTISLRSMLWESGTRLWIGTVLFVPCKALACLYFCTFFLAFLPRVHIFFFVSIWEAWSFPVIVENAIFLAVIIFFLSFANENLL